MTDAMLGHMTGTKQFPGLNIHRNDYRPADKRVVGAGLIGARFATGAASHRGRTIPTAADKGKARMHTTAPPFYTDKYPAGPLTGILDPGAGSSGTRDRSRRGSTRSRSARPEGTHSQTRWNNMMEEASGLKKSQRARRRDTFDDLDDDHFGGMFGGTPVDADHNPARRQRAARRPGREGVHFEYTDHSGRKRKENLWHSMEPLPEYTTHGAYRRTVPNHHHDSYYNHHQTTSRGSKRASDTMSDRPSQRHHHHHHD